MRVHTIKCLTPYFEDVLRGAKPFEVRFNDRSYEIGDTLDLQEVERDSGRYTGRRCARLVTYTLHGGQFGIELGWVVLGLAPGDDDARDTPRRDTDFDARRDTLIEQRLGDCITARQYADDMAAIDREAGRALPRPFSPAEWQARHV